MYIYQNQKKAKLMKWIFKKANEYITGPRNKEYGNAYDNFDDITIGWNVIMKRALDTHGYITPAHSTLMMDWLKTCRILRTIDHEDSWIDKAGYTALGFDFVEYEKLSVEEKIKQTLGKKSENK